MLRRSRARSKPPIESRLQPRPELACRGTGAETTLSDLHPRTIFHLDHTSTWSGSEQQLLHLHQGLLALGLDSRVVCQTEGALEDRLRRERLPHYAMRMIGGLDPGGAWRLRNLLRDPATVVHAHTPDAAHLALWARRLGARAKLVVSHPVSYTHLRAHET